MISMTLHPQSNHVSIMEDSHQSIANIHRVYNTIMTVSTADETAS
jgi:hypothetical protein